jgi:WW domain-containing oxidoreductase
MGFGRRSTAEDVTEGLDLRGKTAVITGVNSGLGQESMRVLAARGARIIGLARTREKAEAACAAVDGDTVPVTCELSDFGTVRDAAREIRAMGMPIDILMTNAGIMAPKQLRHAHGVEMQFATNHLGHFILVNHLIEQVRQAPAGRIVILSSAAHKFAVSGGIAFGNLDASGGYDPWRFYGQSKLANLLHARELSRRLDGTRVTSNALHPGVIQTNLARDAQSLLLSVARLFSPFLYKSVPQGAATQCYVATHPAVDRISGAYFADCREAGTSAWGRDDDLAVQLWKESERLTAIYVE